MISRIDSFGGADLINSSEDAGPIFHLADADGSFTVAASDGTDTPPFPAMHESGDGVLARITVRGIATGQSPLLIPSVDGGADTNPDTIIVAGDGPLTDDEVLGDPIPITAVQPAVISVNETCIAATPTPTPTPSPTPSPTPTPTPAPTPSPTPTPTPSPTPTPTPIVKDRAEGTILRDVGTPLTTDSEGDGATADDPVETTVTPPSGGDIVLFSVTISEMEITKSSTTGFTFFGQQVNIEVDPAATAANPLKVAFLLDSSIIPEGEDKDTIEIFKDGVKVAACTDTSGTASPDPCVSSRELLTDGDIEISVLTSTASMWNFGHAEATGTGTAAGTAAGGDTPSGPSVAGAAAAPRAAPPTGDGIPVDEGGGASVLPWLLVALGVVIAMTATGYVAYSTRGRFASVRATTKRRLSH